MSYIKEIGNYIIKFKDEESYLEARLEKIKLYPDIPFIGFIQNEMYDKSKCEVESIEMMSNDNSIILDSYDNDNNYTINTDLSSSNSFSSVVSYNIVDGDIVPLIPTYYDFNTEGDIINGNINSGSWSVNGAISYGHINTTPQVELTEMPEPAAPPEPEELPEPIDNRFDILDL